MSEFLAIVGDTWRQSRQQVVFIIMCVLLALTAIVFVGYPKVVKDDAGERQFGLMGIEKPIDWAAEGWEDSALQARKIERGDAGFTFSDDEEEREEQEALEERIREEFEAEAADITKFERSHQMWLYLAAQIVFSLSMLLFVAACAAYFPDLLAAGAVDVVLAKPLSRWRVFLGKYFGGLVLFTFVVTVTYALIAGGIGLRTGYWSMTLLGVIPMQVFAAAMLYAIVAFIGVLSRSTSFALIIGYLFYLVIDTAIETASTFQMMGVSASIPLLDKFLSVAHYLPSTGFLKTVSTNQVLYAQDFAWRPVLVCAAWLVVMLGLAFRRFQRTDF